MTFFLGQVLFNKPSGKIGRHPWIIASDPARALVVVLVNLSTKPELSPNCVVEPHECHAISHTSYVRCEDARLVELVKLHEALRQGAFQESKTVTPALLQRVQSMLLNSRHVSNEIKTLLRSQGC